MPRLSTEVFAKWLEAYGRASSEDDMNASAALFAEDAENFESPFVPAIARRVAIRDYQEKGARGFRDKQSSFEIFSVDGNRGIAR